MGSFTVFAHIFLKFFMRSRATFKGLAGHFWPAGHRLGTTALDVGREGRGGEERRGGEGDVKMCNLVPPMPSKQNIWP